MEICDHDVDTAFRGNDTGGPLIMNPSSSPARQASINLSSSSSAKAPDENPPFNSTHQVLGMCPVPNTYGNGTQIYGTLGRRQQRQQRPLSGN